MILLAGLLFTASALWTVDAFRKLTVEENEKLQKNCGLHGPRNERIRQQLDESDLKLFEYGYRAEENQFPWAVKLEIKKQGGIYGCTGSVISPRHVITASHCVNSDVRRVDVIGGAACVSSPFSPLDEQVKCPITSRRERSERRQMVDYVVPDDAIGTGKQPYPPRHSDFTIIELDEEFHIPNVRPICLPSDAEYDRYKNLITDIYGFGDTEVTGPTNGTLKNTELKWMRAREADCIASIIPNGTDEYTMKFSDETEYEEVGECHLRRYAPTDEQSACHGDSGGGAEKTLSNLNKTVLFGVVSGIDEFACTKRPRHGFPPLISMLKPYIPFICERTGICPNNRRYSNIDWYESYYTALLEQRATNHH